MSPAAPFIFVEMSTRPRETTGNTPEPVTRKLRFGEKPTKEETEDAQMIEAHDVLTELHSLRIQTSFLLAQHADHLREKARKEIVIGGWSTFIPNKEDTEKQGEQLEAQSVSRERWIKEIAKKAGLPSGHYKEWSFSHQTRGDSLSPITVVTVTQPWQRNKLFDFTKKNGNTGKLQERFFINEKEVTDWNLIEKEFGNYQEPASKAKELKIQPQISLWDRITGLPLKIGMAITEEAQVPFKHSWRDLTLTHKDTNEYLLWTHFAPDKGIITLYLSVKNIPDVQAFVTSYEHKFNDTLNGGSKAKGKGKGRSSNPSQEAESMPWNHTSHGRECKFPFALQTKPVEDTINHWDVWKSLWTEAIRTATLPFTVNVF